MKFRIVLLACVFAVATSAAQTQSPAQAQKLETKPAQPADPHQPEIMGIRIGMTAQDVLDRMGRMPDQRKDVKDEIQVFWKVPEGVLQVTFRQDNFVSHVGLQFRPPRPVNDFWLEAPQEAGYYGNTATMGQSTSANPQAPGVTEVLDSGADLKGATSTAPRLSSSAAPSGVTGRDVRQRVEYRRGQTTDQDRITWSRQIPTVANERPYRIEVQWISEHRKRRGSEFANFVEYKYVSVAPSDLKAFDKAMTGSGK